VTSIRLKFVQAFTVPSGKVYFYFRRPGVRRIRLPGLPGSEAFMSAYQAALAAGEGVKGVGGSRNAHGTIAALIGLYAETADFKFGIAPSTREARSRILSKLRDEHGAKRVALHRATVYRWLDGSTSASNCPPLTLCPQRMSLDPSRLIACGLSPSRK
jgi:hypothetical protein